MDLMRLNSYMYYSIFARKVSMGKYEYKVVTYDLQAFFGGSVKVNQIENQLNLPGNDGWEMVSCTSSG